MSVAEGAAQAVSRAGAAPREKATNVHVVNVAVPSSSSPPRKHVDGT